MNDQEWLEALRSLPPLTPEEWAKVASGGRLLDAEQLEDQVTHVSDAVERRNQAIAQREKARSQPTPDQRGEKTMQGGSARRVEERRRNGG